MQLYVLFSMVELLLLVDKVIVQVWLLKFSLTKTKLPLQGTILIHVCYTEWPRKVATLTIVNFSDTITQMSLFLISFYRTFFFQQDDTMKMDFGRGIWMLGPYIWGNAVSKMCYFFVSRDPVGTKAFSPHGMPYNSLVKRTT